MSSMYARHAAIEREAGVPSHLAYHYPQSRYEDPETPTESGADFYHALLRGETELPPLAYGAFQEQDVRNVPQYAGHHLQNIAHLQQHFDDQMSYGKPPPHMTMNHVGHRGMAPQYQEDDDDGSAETENSPPAKLSRGHGGHRYDSHPHHFQTQHFQQEEEEEEVEQDDDDGSTDKDKKKKKRICRIAGCGKLDKGRGFCKAHGGGRRCIYEGCDKSARGSSGLCISHGGGPRCNQEGCTKSARTVGGYCKAHGGGRKCVYEGCRKSRRGNDLCLEHGGVEVDDSPTASDQYYDYPPAANMHPAAVTYQSRKNQGYSTSSEQQGMEPVEYGTSNAFGVPFVGHFDAAHHAFHDMSHHQ